MKKTSNRLHSLFAALAALILAAALAVPVFAVEGGFADLYYRMFDDAEVLTEDEDNELEEALEEQKKTLEKIGEILLKHRFVDEEIYLKTSMSTRN